MIVTKAPTPHIGAREGEIAETILLPGDPLRAQFIAEHYLEEVKQFNSVRNMSGYTGIYHGSRVSVMGTGMGCPSMGIYSYELIHIYGCKNLIRIGTAGTFQERVKMRDLVIAMGACTTSGYVEQFGMPGNYACICSYELLAKAVEAAQTKGVPYHVGNVLSSDMLYKPTWAAADKKRWTDMGVLAGEMEAAALYSNAAAAGVNAICMVSISDSGNPEEAVSVEERQTAFTSMIEVALDLVSY